MQILTYRNGGIWLAVSDQKEDSNGHVTPDPALAEITRNLSDCFRCSNLVILTGLGTSLYVNVQPKNSGKIATRAPVPGKRIAPTMANLWDECKTKNAEVFDQVIALTHFSRASDKNIEALLSHCKIAEEFLGDGDEKNLVKKFIATTEETVLECVRFLEVEDDVGLHADFLRRLVRRSTRKLRTKVFTTNYDLCFEYAARKGRYIIVDGFSHTIPQVFDSLYFSYDIVKRESSPDSHDFIPNVFHLYKLHGSVDWTKNINSGEIERDPYTKSPLLIYPRNTKYELSFEQPYIEMMAAFQTALRQPDTGLLVLGFGFNDNHLAEPILSAINSNLHLKVVVCDPSLGPWVDRENNQKEGTDANHPYLSKIRYLIEHGDARLALISSTFEQVVPLMPDIAAETDLEQHYERLRMMREGGV